MVVLRVIIFFITFTMGKKYYVYILTNQNNAIFYVGVTNNLIRRLRQHKNKEVKGFTSKYNLDELAYYEHHSNISNAIAREKELKGWCRSKKKQLIKERTNKNIVVNDHDGSC